MSRPPAGSLASFLAEVPDPRDRSGMRHPPTAMLLHTCCAMLCGCRGYAAIAQWGRDQSIELMLNFPRIVGAWERDYEANLAS